MKLEDFDNPGTFIELPSTLLWVDEFDWSPVKSSVSWAVGGAMIVQQGVKLAGRPITLRSPMSDMGWVYRPVLTNLKAWADTPEMKMKLYLEKPTDTRVFTVLFAEGDKPVSSQPVKGWADHDDGDPYTIEIKLMQVP